MGKKILFVEDDPVSLNKGKDLLTKLGFQVLSACNGSEAAKIIRRELPDAIILDVVLPDCDGFDLGRKLKDHPRTQEIPIAFITAKDKAADIRKGFESGGKIYLTKPFTALALETAIKSLFS